MKELSQQNELKLINEVSELIAFLIPEISNEYWGDDPRILDIDETRITTWFERDRQHVELQRIDTDETIIEWWDGEVTQSIEDGFLSTKDYHQSAYDYAEHLELIPNYPSMDLTIGINDPETDQDFPEWTYQTGDNSYSGSCYSKQYWGVATITRDSIAQDLAEEIVDNLLDQF